MSDKTKYILTKALAFISICVFLVAGIGGTAYLFYYKQAFFGVVNILLAAMAAPYIIQQFKNLLS